MAIDFKEDANVIDEAEHILRKEVSFIENTYDCNVINNDLIDEALETALPDDEVKEGYIERHIAYQLVLEKKISSSLKKDDILDLIKYLHDNIERYLSLAIGAVEFIPEEAESDIDYEYDIVS